MSGAFTGKRPVGMRAARVNQSVREVVVKKSLLAGCLVLASVVGANAATITFTNSTEFFAALGGTPFTTETYEGLAVNSTISPGATVNGITYTSFPGASSGRIDRSIDSNYAAIGEQSLARTGIPGLTDFFFVESIDVSFAPTTAIGVFFNIATVMEDAFFIETAVGPVFNDAACNGLCFLGLISDSPFSSARIGSTTGASGYNLDNLTLATRATPVPDPASTMFLLGSALLALRLAAHRPRSL